MQRDWIPSARSPRAAARLATGGACTAEKTPPMEIGIDDCFNGDQSPSVPPTSSTSDEDGIRAAPSISDEGLSAAVGERERFQAASSQTPRLHRSPSQPMTLSSTALRSSQDVLCDTPLRVLKDCKGPSASGATVSPITRSSPVPRQAKSPSSQRGSRSARKTPSPQLGSSSGRAARRRSEGAVLQTSPYESPNFVTPSPVVVSVGEAIEIVPLELPPAAPAASVDPAACTAPATSAALAASAASVAPVASIALLIPSNPHHSTAASDEADVCCICLEEYTAENPMFRGKCLHHFHLSCLMEWKQRSNTCPMCCSETLRGVGDFEASQSETRPGSSEVSRQRAMEQRDAELAQKLQHKYIRQAQRRTSQDSFTSPTSRMVRQLPVSARSDPAFRSPLQSAEAERDLFRAISRELAQQNHRQVEFALTPDTRYLERLGGETTQQTTSAHQHAESSAASPSSQSARRNRRKPSPGCSII